MRITPARLYDKKCSHCGAFVSVTATELLPKESPAFFHCPICGWYVQFTSDYGILLDDVDVRYGQEKEVEAHGEK